jgi:hypothetical protein
MAGCFLHTELGAQAWAAFERDLPQLLERSRRQWVAYLGSQQLGISHTPTELFDECLHRGFSPEEFVIALVEPVGGTEAVGLGLGSIEEVKE